MEAFFAPTLQVIEIIEEHLLLRCADVRDSDLVAAAAKASWRHALPACRKTNR
jgi:hypothetical protein